MVAANCRYSLTAPMTLFIPCCIICGSLSVLAVSLMHKGLNCGDGYGRFSVLRFNFFYCRSQFFGIAVVRNQFSEITPANRNRFGRNFTCRRRFRWHAFLQTLAPLAKLAQNDDKHAFCEISGHQNNSALHPLPGGRFP